MARMHPRMFNSLIHPLTNAGYKFDHYNHIKLWNWLSEHPDKHKSDWPEWEYNEGKVKYAHSDCFSCEFVMIILGFILSDRPSRVNIDKFCSYCPFGDFHGKLCLDSLYWCWNVEQNHVKKSELARQIRDLPIRKDVEVLTNYIKY